MKSGIVFSDKVIAVSPTYSNEIQTEFYGEGPVSYTHLNILIKYLKVKI